jgi:hypothetical protein
MWIQNAGIQALYCGYKDGRNRTAANIVAFLQNFSLTTGILCLRPASNRDNDFGMSRTTRSNLPQDCPLKWNLAIAAREFGLTEVTLRKALAQNSIRGDEAGLYSTKEIREAVYGDLHSEKILTQRQLTRRYELSNRIVEGSVVNKAALMQLFSSVADAMVSRVRASNLDRMAQDDLLSELSRIRPGIDGIAADQSKLPRDGRYDDDGGDADDQAFSDEESSQSENKQNRPKPSKRPFRMKPGFVKAS